MYGQMNEVVLESGEKVNGYTVNIAYPKKTAVVRLPTADEITKYQNAYVEQGKAKGKKSEDAQRAPDVALFKAIRLDAGVEFDSYEAESVISRLTTCSAVGCEKDDDGYAVTLTTAFGEVQHFLRPLSMKELATCRAAGWKGNSMLALYAEICHKTEGYATGVEVPPHHKTLAMSEVAIALYAIDPIQIPN